LVGEVASTFAVDETVRHSGTVAFFDKRRGYGFISLSKLGVVPGDKVMVHWSEIQSKDKWPFLVNGLEVEFSLTKVAGTTGATIKGAKVTKPGNQPLSMDEEEEKELEFVGGKTARYQATVKWFNQKNGFGYVTLREPVEKIQDVRVTREEILGGEVLPLAPGLPVELGLYKNKHSTICGYSLTQPGGAVITRAVGEARQEFGPQQFTGELQWFADRGRLGFILPDNFEALPKEVQDKSTAAAQRRANKTQQEAFEGLTFRTRDMADPNTKWVVGMQVKFSPYVDSASAGAYNVTPA